MQMKDLLAYDNFAFTRLLTRLHDGFRLGRHQWQKPCCYQAHKFITLIYMCVCMCACVYVCVCACVYVCVCVST